MSRRLLSALAVAVTTIAALSATARGATDPAAPNEIEAAEPHDELDGTAPAVVSGSNGACSKSTRAVLRACKHEARDDYWVGYGRCLNLSNGDERRKCIAEVEAARREALDLCREQFEGRKEVCGILGQRPYDPEIDPDDFLSPEDVAKNPNPYFPLVVGNRWTYRAGTEIIEVTVTEETKEILGVECFVVRDLVKDSGVPIEDTDDWYAQDEDGNVWYFGELVQNFEDGELVNLDGSWQAGVDQGKAGIIMKAHPKVGDVYRQEFLLGEVEDLGRVLSITGTETVPAASCDHNCVITEDFTPVEPGNVTQKYYTPNVGLMLETFPESTEREELIEFHAGTPAPHGARAVPTGRLESRMALRTTPNPFRSETMIRFDLERDAVVSVDVFDLAGRKIRSLESGQRGAGSHTVRWDGTDAGHARVAEGMYFVRVRAGDQARTTEVVRVR